MITVSEFMVSAGTTQLDPGSGDQQIHPTNSDSTMVGRMLHSLTQRLPEANSRPFYEDVRQAEREGLWAVTVPLRVPLVGKTTDDMKFLRKVAWDMDAQPTNWVLVLEFLGLYPGVSVWRKPHPLTKEEVSL